MKAQNYNYPLLEKVFETITVNPDKFLMESYFGEMGQRCIAGWAIEISEADCDRATLRTLCDRATLRTLCDRTDNDSVFCAAKELLNLSDSEATNLFTFLCDISLESFLSPEEISRHATNVLRLILEKREYTINQIINSYIKADKYLHQLHSED